MSDEVVNGPWTDWRDVSVASANDDCLDGVCTAGKPKLKLVQNGPVIA